MNRGEFRDLGHRVVDLLADYLEHIEEKPVFPNVDPKMLTKLFAEPLPQDPSPAGKVLSELEEKLLPYCTHVGHPGYMGLITPSPNPVGIIGDFICSALNQNIGAFTIGPAAVAMERRTVRWLTELVGYGENAGGNLTSGGMMANFIGLKLARIPFRGTGYSKKEFRNAGPCTRRRNATFRWIRPLTRLAWDEQRCARCRRTLNIVYDWTRWSQLLPKIVNEAYGRCVLWASSAARTRGQSIRCANFEQLQIGKEFGFTPTLRMEVACCCHTRGPCVIRGWSSRTLSRLILTNGSTLHWMRELFWLRMIAD